MIIRYIALPLSLLALVAASVVSIAQWQRPGRAPRPRRGSVRPLRPYDYHPARAEAVHPGYGTSKPLSTAIKLCAPVTASTAAAVWPMTAPDPVGIEVDVGASLVGVLQVTSFPSGGTNTTLWVNFQTSYDDGLTWIDLFLANCTSTGTFYIPLSTVAPALNGGWIGDGATFSNPAQVSIATWPIGKRLRIKYGTNLGSPAANGSFAFQASVQPTGLASLGGLQRPIELAPPVSASANVTGVPPAPLGKHIKANATLVAVLELLAIPSGGSGQLLDVYFQHSCDDGQTWCDFGHIQTNGIGLGMYSRWSYCIGLWEAGPTTGLAPITDGTLPANTGIQGPIGDRLRIKYSANMGSGNTGPWMFHTYVYPN